MVDLRPGVPDGFKNVVELETEDISAYHDKSIKGIGDFMEFYLSESNINLKESITKDIQNTPTHQ
jgi:hypothetical protein